MVFYFAFGSNMAREVFLGRRTMQCDVGDPAVLDDHRLAFTQPGLLGIEPSFANIERAPGEQVHGVVWELSEPEFERLLTTESPNYEPYDVEVRGRRVGTVKARALRSRKVQVERPPSRRYQRLLVRGAREHDLPASYVTKLETMPVSYTPIVSEAFEHLVIPVVGFWFTHGLSRFQRLRKRLR